MKKVIGIFFLLMVMSACGAQTDERGFYIEGKNIGKHKETNTLYDPEGYDKDGFNLEGYDFNGYTREDYEKEGLDNEKYDGEEEIEEEKQ